MRKKGKVYPSPPSSSSSSVSSHSTKKDAASVLKLLPATILVLASALSLEDKEVLAYMITRSLNWTNPSSIIEENKKNGKKSNTHHKSPLFDCDCFDCYTSYWFRWDCSVNRELIHEAIEAFEEQLSSGEQSKKTRNRKRDKTGRRGTGKVADIPAPEIEEACGGNDLGLEVESDDGGDGEVVMTELDLVTEKKQEEEEDGPPEMAANTHVPLARKVLPDVLGLLNSRLLSLWGPGV